MTLLAKAILNSDTENPRQKRGRWLGIAGMTLTALLAAGCSRSTEEASLAAGVAPPDSFPAVEVIHVFEPPGESNVRSSFRLADSIGLIGTEETGDIFKTEDDGRTWRKVWDGGDVLDIADVRNFIRAQDGHIYITTTEPATVTRSRDEGETWEKLADAPASRTVGLVELDNGTMLVGLRRAEQEMTSIIRSEDRFASYEWVPVSTDEAPQNVTCFGYRGGPKVLAGVGYEGSGKIFLSTDYGKTWRKKAEFSDARDLMNFFTAGDDIYVLASGISTLFKSSDGGETWGKAHQFWPKGFLGQCTTFERNGHPYWVMSGTDQSEEPIRHVVLISDDPAKSWYEWIQLGTDQTGGANNLVVLSPETIVVGAGNHSAQGKAFTLSISD